LSRHGIAVLGRADSKAGQGMRRSDFKSMTTDELWRLYDEVGSLLGTRLEVEKRALESRLNQLGRYEIAPTQSSRRHYPKVHPKFQNPADPTQTWAGRGKTPRWVTQMLKAGKSMDDLRVRAATA